MIMCMAITLMDLIDSNVYECGYVPSIMQKLYDTSCTLTKVDRCMW